MGHLLPLSSALLTVACTSIAPTVRPVACPASRESTAPNLAEGLDGRVYLSWIEPADTGHALRFSAWEGNGWSPARTAAQGEDWFVNWADLPSIAAAADGTLAAHWLAKSAPATYAYDVNVAFSTDGGDTWSDPSVPHRDGTETEHGFVSLAPSAGGTFDAIWLDGRAMAETPPGPMSLRHARLGPGRPPESSVVDARVCDCCATDLARGGRGLVAVYRDRSASEVRDVSVAVHDGRWSPPGPVATDGWTIASCPVNGPALAARGEDVAVAWFTEADEPRVQLAFSSDGGRTFGAATRVDEGDPLGRVDVVLTDASAAWVVWIERDGEKAWILAREATAGNPSAAIHVARTEPTRAAGFPKLVRSPEGGLLVAWPSAEGVRTVRL